jgi:chromosome segregation ATPase
VESLRTDNGWLEYWLQAVRDELLEQGAQTVEGGSAVDQVKAALLERDEALRKAREDLAVMQTVAAEWETEVASTRAQLQQDRASLEGARSWQSQVKEKAKEAEQLRVELTERATALATAEGTAPEGAERVPAGGGSAPARAIRSRGGPSCPRA